MTTEETTDMQVYEELEEKLTTATTRRSVVKTGVKLAYAAPLVAASFKLSARGAGAQTLSPTEEEACNHSNGLNGGCMGACTSSDAADTCGSGGNFCDGVDIDPDSPSGQGPCQEFCPSGQGGENPCCNPGLCDSGNFVCLHNDATGGDYIAYNGPTAGC
jgi:hypothetical protein